MSTPLERLHRLSSHLTLKDELPTPFIRSTLYDKNRGINILENERKKVSFNLNNMINYLDGNKNITNIKNQIMNEIQSNLEYYQDQNYYDLDRKEKRFSTFQTIRKIFRSLMIDADDMEIRNTKLELFAQLNFTEYVRRGVFHGLFMGAIQGQGDNEQQNEWLPKCLLGEIYGCFAMTELGHGSFLRGLETTATYDKINQEFIIHSPTDTSTKWWIGGAAHTATHTVCYAQLIIDNINYGLHNFIVPLRDMNTHEKLPGITIGDCGAKLGCDGIDNGWIQFNNVHIPHEYMLQRYSKVDKNTGEYIKPPNKKLAYGALIGTRAMLIKDGVNMQKKALTIAIRFAAVRLQGITSNGDEIQLLDYRSHQHRLLPLLAGTYAWHFQMAFVATLLDELDTGLLKADLSLLPDVHGTMSGLKAYSSWYTTKLIETCRQSCGGQGYSDYNGLGPLLRDFTVMCTFEGDNTVMALQTSRYLVRTYNKYLNNEEIGGSVKYLLKNFDENEIWDVQTPWNLHCPDRQKYALEYLVKKVVVYATKKFNEIKNNQNLSFEEAFVETQIELLEAARIHVYFNVAYRFIEGVFKIKDDKPELFIVLRRLSDLFFLTLIEDELKYFLEDNFITKQQIHFIRSEIQSLYTEIRPDAVSLVDSFNLCDGILNSCIGVWNGDIYGTLLRRVKRVPESKDKVAPYYGYISNFINGEDRDYVEKIKDIMWEQEQEEEDNNNNNNN